LRSINSFIDKVIIGTNILPVGDFNTKLDTKYDSTGDIMNATSLNDMKCDLKYSEHLSHPMILININIIESVRRNVKKINLKCQSLADAKGFLALCINIKTFAIAKDMDKEGMTIVNSKSPKIILLKV